MSKLADVNHIIIFTPKKIKIFDGSKITLTSTEELILQRWQGPKCGLWCIPLHPLGILTNTMQEANEEKVDTNAPSPSNHNILSNLYEFPSTKQIVQYFCSCRFVNQNNMDQGPKSIFLCHVAHVNIKSSI